MTATFSTGDQLDAWVGSDGTVAMERHATKPGTRTVGAAHQAFFGAKGGKIGIETAAAPNALLDGVGGGIVAR